MKIVSLLALLIFAVSVLFISSQSDQKKLLENRAVETSEVEEIGPVEPNYKQVAAGGTSALETEVERLLILEFVELERFGMAEFFL